MKKNGIKAQISGNEVLPGICAFINGKVFEESNFMGYNKIKDVSIILFMKTHIRCFCMNKVFSLEEISKISMPIVEKHGVAKLYVYGSYARKKAIENSDIDLLIDKGNKSP